MSNIHLKTAFGSIRRSPFQAMAAIFVLSVTFLVITLVSVLVYSSEQAIKHFETRPQVIAFLLDDVPQSEVSALQQKLKVDERVKEVNFVSKEQALEIYKEATSDNPLLSELVSPSIFPASIEFSLNDLSYAEAVIEEVKQNEIVDRVGFTASLEGESGLTDVVNRLRTVTWYIRVGGGVFAGFLTGTSFLVLLVIISMRMSARRQEIEILDLIGATAGFIRSPIVLEALIYSIVGVFIGWVCVFVAILYLTPNIITYFGEIPVLPRDTLELVKLFGIILGLEMVVGVFLSLTGSLIAVSRVRKRR
jgi:cell division transport system permease protein